MKFTTQLSFIPILCVLSSAQAALPPLLNPPLNHLTIYSGAAITTGASSLIGGKIQAEAAVSLGASTVVGGHIVAGAAVTLGASARVGGYVNARDAGTIGEDATIGGDLTTGDAATLGATTIDGDIMVDGDLKAGAAILVGTKAVIAGNLRSGAAASADIGADSIVRGNATAGTALTLGAGVKVGTDPLSDGNVQAGTGAVALGVNAAVAGNARAGTNVTLAGGASVGGDIIQNSIEQFTNDPKAPIDDQSPQLLEVQAELAAMVAPAGNQLPTSMTTSRTLTKGIYHTTALTTTAGITLTLDGEGVDGHWLINSDSFIAFGASTKIVLHDVTPNSTITWNAGGYTSSGEDADLIGVFFAYSYILTGARTTLAGIGSACGGLFTTTGAVSLGANNTIGSIGCKERSAIDHYQIIHDGQGLTCEAETVTIKACTNADVESCTLSTKTVTLDVTATGSVSVTDSLTFTGSGTASLAYKDAEPTLLSLENASIQASNPTVCSDGNTDSCDLMFADAGFRFLNAGSGSPATLTNQIAGTSFPLGLQAVENNNGVCEGLFTGNTAIDLSQENVAPGGSGGLSFSVNGLNIAKTTSATRITLNFGADSSAIIPEPIYHDAGQIRLHAYYDLDDVTVSGSSNTFWVSPAKLVVSAQAGALELNSATATAAPTHKAGDAFTLTLSAFNSLEVITPNYSPGQMQLKLERRGPTLSDSVDGELTYAVTSTLATNTSAVFQDVTLTNFASGLSTYTAAQYSEVGLLTLEAQDSDYGNADIVVPATAVNIGRFIPDHFTQTVVVEGLFHATCNATTTLTAYSGQKNETTHSMGAILYASNPILAITAYNKQGDITQNYYEDTQGSADDYMRLSGSDISISAPTSDSLARGVDNNLLPLTADIYSGTLSQNDLTVSPSVALPKGVLHYRLSAADNFFYNRSANARVAPFISTIDLTVATIIDADNVNATSTAGASPTGVEIRFGRLLLENSYGPETSNLPQPMRLEHFDGTAFIATSDNNCASYDASRISLTAISLDPSFTKVLGGTGHLFAGKTQALELEATGLGNQGEIGVTYDAYEWLKYDWYNGGTYDDNPSAVAYFGLYRGSDGVFYWREGSN